MTHTNRADSTIGIHMSDSPTMATSMCKGIAKRSTLALREQERKPQSASLRAANTFATGTLIEKS
ncbi:MAG: hypothetical protein CK531_11310 [Gemmatimonadetes bacterium]|nr:MAG: hypothetical protein CK531_11310 [Gemmatimonadota bacterium]